MIVKAFVVLKPGTTPTPTKTLQDHVKSILAPFKYPGRSGYMAALPRTETGKLQRFKLRPP
jgi:2-aminobenzoate-CoA ligase